VCMFAASEAGVESKGLVRAVNTNTQFGVFVDLFFKEVHLPLQAYHFHPFERIPDFVMMLVPEGD
jgi:hypothetical protein